jgi:hypothetical protein
MSFELILSIISIIFVFLGLIFQYFGWIVKLKDQIAKSASDLTDKLTAFEKDVVARLATVETAQKFFQKYIDDIIPSVLHHPDSIEKDKLLENFKLLTPVGLKRLKNLLMNEIPGLTEKKDPMVVNYIFLLARIDQKLDENKGGIQ